MSVVAQADGREEHSVDWKSEDTENEEGHWNEEETPHFSGRTILVQL